MARKQYQIPFKDGKPMNYVWGKPDDIEWRDNFEFEATLRFTGFSRGRSAAHAVFEDTADDHGGYDERGWIRNEDGSSSRRPEYIMFLTDLGELLKNGYCANTISGPWTFQKRGTNYGIRSLLEPREQAS